MIKKKLIKAGGFLTELLYPSCCPVCGDILGQDLLVCLKCREKVPLIRGSRCKICGKPVPEGEPLCGDCLRVPHEFDVSAALCLYNDVMRKSLSELKYKGRRDIGKSWGQLLAAAYEPLIRRWHIDVIVPVPIHKSRMKKRGYNQAAVIAEECGRKWHLPVNDRAVIRQGRTRAMKELDRNERMKNLLSAFGEGEVSVRGQRVLLIDDIYTTGSTLDAVSHILKKEGACFVGGLVICIGNSIVLE